MWRICAGATFSDGAQDEIVILRTFESGAEAEAFDQIGCENAEVRKIILGEEEGVIPIGFEMGIRAPAEASSLSSSL